MEPQVKTQYLTIEEVAELLNQKQSTIRYWVQTKKIPYTKIGRSIRFNASNLHRWIESNNYNQEN